MTLTKWYSVNKNEKQYKGLNVSIKNIVEKLFCENTNYTTPDQATNQASSLVALSTDLYTDSKRFVYELLQNADDSPTEESKVKVWIKIFDGVLVVAHSGKSFDERDVKGLCNVNNGTKKSDASKTGYKGIGFKSVFGQSEKVTVYTNSEYFRFEASFEFDWSWDTNKADWERLNDRQFVHPWQIIPIYTECESVSEPIHQYLQKVDANVATIIVLDNVTDTLLAVQELSDNVNMFIFLKNISEINFELDETNLIEINYLSNDEIELKKNKSVISRWLINKVDLDIPNELTLALADEKNIPNKLLLAKSIELTLAAKVYEDEIIELSDSESVVYSYLPTDEIKYKFPVLVNTSFLTNANREHLHVDSKWNHWLFGRIASEIFNWISELVVGKYQYQAYRLIPKKLPNDELGKNFNVGMDESIENVCFVITNSNQRIKVKDSIVDFTYLSEKPFIGEEKIKSFISELNNINGSQCFSLIRSLGFGRVLKTLGAQSFEWKDLPLLLRSPSFSHNYSVDENIKLIKHLKYLCEKESVTSVTNKVLIKFPFIFDHQNKLNIPSEIYFPTSTDNSWDDSESELSFLHKKIQEWLTLHPDMRVWMEQLGVVVKTDISFIHKTLIPHSDSYINKENAVQSIRDLFNLYNKEELKSELLSQLSSLKLLTKKGNLISAKNSILSNDYSPRVSLEGELDSDVFISDSYMDGVVNKDEWKRFFKLLKVSDGITYIQHKERMNKSDLIGIGYKKEYFEEDDKKFNPCYSTFISDSYKEISTLNYIHKTIDNYSLARVFWKDVINNISVLDLSKPTIAFWGNSGMQGQITGDKVGNYVQWAVNKLRIIPVLSKKCELSCNVFLNTDGIKKISGDYLPVFDGVELSSDWKSFFNFKTELQLVDYLYLLSEISRDSIESNNITSTNSSRIQLVYEKLIESCVNWGSSELQTIADWSSFGLLLNTNQEFVDCKSIHYFLDGNDAIFQEQFNFISLNSANKNHQSIIIFLKAFNIKILEQRDFKINVEESNISETLRSKLELGLPFLKDWIESESEYDKNQTYLVGLDIKLLELKLYEAESLKIRYEGINFTKNVNVHLNEDELYVSKPWRSNKVLLQLPSILCRYFNLMGHEKKFNFILCSDIEEIIEYFEQESINISTNIAVDNNIISRKLNDIQSFLPKEIVKSFSEVEIAINNGTSPDFFHIPTADYKRLIYAETLISRAVENIIQYLDKFPEYDCSDHYEIAPSIIGGVKKGGQDLTIVARPSDNDAVLLYYTSEFDVLEYVDAEFWCEDGINVPQKITLGHLLKETKINRIPVNKFSFEEHDFDEFIQKQTSIDFEYDAVPPSPYKVAQIISSFGNTEGGILVYGIQKNVSDNKFVGLSTDFRMDEITNKALMMISPLPKVTYDWAHECGKNLFIIKVDKSTEDMLIGNDKFIRENSQTIIEEDTSLKVKEQLAIADFDTTVAIIIGIEDYKPRGCNQVPSVKYAKNDALLFKDMLVERFEVSEHNIYMYLNEDALKSDLENGLGYIFHSLSEKDRLVFYYVGHGFHDGTTNFLTTYDTYTTNITETAVSLRKILLDPLLKSKCKSGLVFIDACAQSFINDRERALITDLNNEDFQLFKSEHPSFGTFLSCQPGQSSYSCHELEHGIWTHFLNEGFNLEGKGAVKFGKYITDRSLSDFLSKNVPSYTKANLDFEQNPKSILDAGCENVIIKI